MSLKEFAPNAAVTGIGSLPFLEVDQAIQFVKEFSPEIPFWPQLPRRSSAEHMLMQPFWCCREVLQPPLGGRLPAIRSGEERRFIDLLGAHSEDKLAEEAAPGFWKLIEQIKNGALKPRAIKAHMVGPVTALRGLRLDSQPASRMPEVALAITDFLSRQISMQLDSLLQLGLPVVFFLDEPMLNILAVREGAAGDEAVLASALDDVIQGARRKGVIVGLHCCAKIELDLFLRFEIDAVSFDLSVLEQSLQFALASRAARNFLLRDGLFLLGVFPTTSEPPVGAARQLEQQILSELEIAGIDRTQFLRRSLFSPSCGLGLTDVRHVEPIFRNLRELSGRLRSFIGE